MTPKMLRSMSDAEFQKHAEDWGLMRDRIMAGSMAAPRPGQGPVFQRLLDTALMLNDEWRMRPR